MKLNERDYEAKNKSAKKKKINNFLLRHLLVLVLLFEMRLQQTNWSPKYGVWVKLAEKWNTEKRFQIEVYVRMMNTIHVVDYCVFVYI